MPGSLYFGTSKVCPVILKNEPALPSYQITGSGVVSSKSMALTGDEFSNVTSVNSYGFSYAFYKCTGLIGSINLSNLSTMATNACEYMFANCTGITSVVLGTITAAFSVSAYQSFQYMFYNCTSLVSADLRFKEMNGWCGCYHMFEGCTNLSDVSFSNLQKMDNNCVCQYMFKNCTSLTTLSFPALLSNFTTWSGVFDNMLYGVTGCTVHFPSNLQSVIGSWSSVSNGFGGTSTTVMFDLPSTGDNNSR